MSMVHKSESKWPVDKYPGRSFHVAWLKLYTLLLLLVDSDVSRVDVSAIVRLMEVLMSGGDMSGRAKKGVAVLSEAVGDGVFAYYGSNGAVIGFGYESMEVNKEDIEKKFERGEKIREIIDKEYTEV